MKHMVTAEFELRTKERVSLKLGEHFRHSQSLDCENLLNQHANGWVITQKHSHPISRFNLKGPIDFALLSFDESGLYTGMVPSINAQEKQTFHCEVSEPISVIIPLATFLQIEGVIKIEITKHV